MSTPVSRRGSVHLSPGQGVLIRDAPMTKSRLGIVDNMANDDLRSCGTKIPGLDGSPSSIHASDPQEADTITSLDGDFFKLAGFCDGAIESLCGGVGVEKIRKVGYGYHATAIAKCKRCQWEVDWKIVHADNTMSGKLVLRYSD
jgi:hypothetical protein